MASQGVSAAMPSLVQVVILIVGTAESSLSKAAVVSRIRLQTAALSSHISVSVSLVLSTLEIRARREKPGSVAPMPWIWKLTDVTRWTPLAAAVRSVEAFPCICRNTFNVSGWNRQERRPVPVALHAFRDKIVAVEPVLLWEEHTIPRC